MTIIQRALVAGIGFALGTLAIVFALLSLHTFRDGAAFMAMLPAMGFFGLAYLSAKALVAACKGDCE